jgi:hypothetical protein
MDDLTRIVLKTAGSFIYGKTAPTFLVWEGSNAKPIVFSVTQKDPHMRYFFYSYLKKFAGLAIVLSIALSIKSCCAWVDCSTEIPLQFDLVKTTTGENLVTDLHVPVDSIDIHPRGGKAFRHQASLSGTGDSSLYVTLTNRKDVIIRYREDSVILQLEFKHTHNGCCGETVITRASRDGQVIDKSGYKYRIAL